MVLFFFFLFEKRMERRKVIKRKFEIRREGFGKSDLLKVLKIIWLFLI